MTGQYYWFEWADSWGLWIHEGERRRCVVHIDLQPNGWWHINEVRGCSVDDRKFINRFKTLEKAKAMAVIHARFPREGRE